MADRLAQVRYRIREAAERHGRQADSIQLLAVSKTRSPEEVREATGLGLMAFGESYLQEAMDKIRQLSDLPIAWHFIGRLQSNKTRPIAEHFDWVHSVASLKHAQRLSEQRPHHMKALNICLQVNTSEEESKGGHRPEDLSGLLEDYARLPNIEVRGLMTIPAPTADPEAQHLPFRRLRQLRDALRCDDRPLDTLSMGMSQDLEAAIAEGSNLLRIGTAIFGPRRYNMKD